MLTQIFMIFAPVAFLLFLISNAHALTISTTGVSEPFSVSNTFHFGGNYEGNYNISTSAYRQVRGLKKFDGALGTLTGVTISAHGFTTPEGSIVGHIYNPFGGAHVAVDLPISLALLYAPSTDQATRYSVFSGSGWVYVGCSSSGAGENGNDTLCRGTTNIESYSSAVVDNSETYSLSSFSPFEITDFVGNGEIPSLYFAADASDAWLAFVTSRITLLDVTGGFLVSVGPGSVTLSYTYTPAVVPLPAALPLFATAFAGLGLIARWSTGRVES